MSIVKTTQMLIHPATEWSQSMHQKKRQQN